jgi:hypothetical protein
MSTSSRFVTQTWFLCAVFALGGLAIGTGLDGFIKRRGERPKTPTVEGPAINREILAMEAETLAEKIGVLLGEHAAKHQIAWAKEVASKNQSPFRSETSKVDAWLTRRFTESHYADAMRIIMTAQKCISLDRGELWQLSHGIGHSQAVDLIFHLLQKIAVSLRQSQPDVPLFDKYAENAKKTELAMSTESLAGDVPLVVELGGTSVAG